MVSLFVRDSLPEVNSLRQNFSSKRQKHALGAHPLRHTPTFRHAPLPIAPHQNRICRRSGKFWG